MTADTTTDVKRLVQRAEDDPTSVTATDIRPYLDADDDITRKRALDVCQAVAYSEPARIDPLLEDVIDFVDDDFLAIKHAALGTVGHVVQANPDPIAERTETLVGALDGETPLTRFLASKTIALLSAERPERVAEHVEGVFGVLAEESPDVPEEIKQPSFGQPDEYEPVREQVGENIAQNENARELAAKTLVEIVKNEPEAIASHVDELSPYLDDDNEIVTGAIVEVVATLASEDYEVPETVVAPLEQSLQEDSTQLQARSLRALGYLSATDAVETIETVADETDDEELAAFAEDTAKWLRTASEE